MQVGLFFVPCRDADGEIECLPAFGEQWVEESHVSQSKQEEKRCISQPIARKTEPSETRKPFVRLFTCSSND